MFLKRLDIQGFKTFASRTIFDFGPGVSAIVGPNGSGKSNIADAVRWGLGEQNPRAVRCRHGEDVIFAGSSKRAPVGMAEVTLTFDNSTNWLPIEYADVAITRRAYRSGESEYLINGARVRLRDVADLLRRASLEAGGHVVVGQGLVDTVLSQRADERKALVENLAGLRHYYVRRDEAEGRLRAAEGNLESIRAVIAETEPVLATLAEQAEVARAYAGVRDELHVHLRQAYAHQRQSLVARAAEAQERAGTASADLRAAEAALEQGRAHLARIGAQEAAAAADLTRLEAEARRAADAREEAERDLAVARARAESQRRRAADLEGDLSRLAGRRSAARDDARRTAETLAAVAARQEQSEAEARAIAAEEAAHEDALRRGHQSVRRAEDEAADGRRRQEGAAREVAEATAAEARARDDLALRAEALRRADEALAAAAGALAAAVPRLAASKGAAEEAAGAARRLDEAHGAARRTLDAAMAACDEGRRALAAAEGRREMLLRWLADVERTHPLLAGSRPSDVLGSVAEALRIPRQWQSAVAAVLGPALEGAVVRDDVALLRVARDGGSRRMVAVPVHDEGDGDRAARRAALLQRFVAATKTAAPGPGEAIVGWTDSLVADAHGGRLAARLLGHSLVVRDLETALACRQEDADVWFVTPAGEALLPGRVVVYGRDDGLTQLLEFHDELGRLPEEIEALRRRLDSLEAAAARHRAANEELGREVAEARRAAAARADEARSLEGDVVLHERLHRAAEAERLRAARDLAARQEHVGTLQARLGPLQEREQAARAAREQAEAHLALVRREQSTRLADRDARRVRQQLVSAALGLTRQEAATARGVAQRAAAALAEVEQEVAAKEAQYQRLGAEAASHAEAETRATERRERVVQQMAALTEALGPARERAAALRAERAEASAALARQEGEHSGLVAAARGAGEAAARAARELEALAETVEAELGIGLADLPEPQTPAQGIQARLRALRGRLAAFGAVNQRAVADYEATAARVAFLRDQVRDIEEAIALLRGVIDEANASVREQFSATVAALDGHFVTHFRQLFGGGTCALRATYDSDGMPAGVEVNAQPPGKRAQDLALLSGGERAMVALALLFAMLAVRPVPFCLLDEVEAALDESNTGRFVGILRSLSASTQFVLITHNRGTMVQADSLYGITMADAGTSQVASLALRGEDGAALNGAAGASGQERRAPALPGTAPAR